MVYDKLVVQNIIGINKSNLDERMKGIKDVSHTLSKI